MLLFNEHLIVYLYWISCFFRFRTVFSLSYITGLLKEYLRELPEPVFSNCLYQMLVDAMGVFLPDDPDGNAKLVFSILDCLPKANRVRPLALHWFRIMISACRHLRTILPSILINIFITELFSPYHGPFIPGNIAII